ncbi:family transcriptional regulator [Pelomyxa schiedti]|nr:family transcriptional regulator [Pelomyxa schiedti]
MHGRQVSSSYHHHSSDSASSSSSSPPSSSSSSSSLLPPLLSSPSSSSSYPSSSSTLGGVVSTTTHGGGASSGPRPASASSSSYSAGGAGKAGVGVWERARGWWARAAQRRRKTALWVVWEWRGLGVLAKLAVCAYFGNLGGSYLVHWVKAFIAQPAAVAGAVPQQVQSAGMFPLTAIPLIVCACMLAFAPQYWGFGVVLALLAGLDAGSIIISRLFQWLFLGNSLYINELMTKKLSMLGCIIMVLVNEPHFKKKVDITQRALKGLIGPDEPRYHVSQATSVVLLIVRALISGLFLFVGYGEILRQWMRTHPEQFNVRTYVPGDGHNQMWLKLFEALIALPFAVGYKATITALALASLLVTEAFTYWRFWATSLGEKYTVHARDHFLVNLGVAGGLYLLAQYGVGKYSVDEMLAKKKE